MGADLEVQVLRELVTAIEGNRRALDREAGVNEAAVFIFRGEPGGILSSQPWLQFAEPHTSPARSSVTYGTVFGAAGDMNGDGDREFVGGGRDDYAAEIFAGSPGRPAHSVSDDPS